MPRDMAMERPDAWIIRVVLEHDVARRCGGARLDELDVAALRVLLMGDGAVPGADALGQDVEVVSVQVHGVRGGEFIFHDDSDRGVGAEVVGVPLRVEGVGYVALVCEDEHRVAGSRTVSGERGGDEGGGLLVVAAEGFVVHVEEEHAGSVGVAGDDDVLFCCWVGSRWEGEEWGCQREVVLLCISVSIFAVVGWNVKQEGKKKRNIEISLNVRYRICCHRRELLLSWALRWY